MKSLLHSLSAALGAAALLTLQFADSAEEPSFPTRIVLVGDSTVASHTGWGDSFGRMLEPGVE